MEPKEPRAHLFRFSYPRQERIYRRLRLVGPGPASFYRDACRLMSAERLLDTTTHLVAHLLREIESALRKVLESVAQRSERLKKRAKRHGKEPERLHEFKILAVLEFLNIPETHPVAQAWLKLARQSKHYGLSARSHRDALRRPRPLDHTFREFWNEMEMVFDFILERLETRYLEYFSIMDKLIKKPSPTRKDAHLLKQKIPNNLVIFNYFFNRLKSPKWLDLLQTEGFFKHPPEPDPDEERGILGPPWPESKYLARMASIEPEKVFEIAIQVQDTENMLVLEDLADAAIAIATRSPEAASEFVPKMKKWIELPYQRILPEKLGKLAVSLAKGNRIDEAIDLTQALLKVFPDPHAIEKTEEAAILPRLPEPQARFANWDYEHILKNDVPDLIKVGGERAFVLLCDLLEDAVNLSLRPQEKTGGPKDFSYIWRPAIEEHEQNLNHSIRNILVSGVRDSAELLVQSNNSYLERLVEILEDKPWRIFHRIAFHILRLFPDVAPQLVAARLTEFALFDDLDIRHEYALLMRSCFRQLEPKQQEKVLNWIKRGPGPDEMKILRERDLLSDEKLERQRKIWQRDRLSLLVKHLPKKWKRYYQALIDDLGEPKNVELPVQISVSWNGPTSPKTLEELRKMTINDLVKFLRSWRPSGDSMAPSPEGLGRQLTPIVAAAPQRFACEAERFQNVDPTYIREIITGFQEAVKKNRKFEWKPVLQLCHWVIEQPREILGRKGEYADLDPGWVWTRQAIAKLLSVGFESNGTQIPFDLRTMAWEVLRPLTDDPDPTAEREASYEDTTMDPATLSINTVRGEAMHAVIRYALWIRRHVKNQPKAEELLKGGFNEMKEVREVLDKHLDISKEKSLAIRAVFGWWFPWLILLDETWATENVGNIFPSKKELRKMHYATWEAYITFCAPYHNVFDLLREEYERAVDQIGPIPTETWRLAGPEEHLTKHLMYFYGYGKICLDKKKGLLARFFANAPDALRGCALESVGKGLRETLGQVAPEIIDRFKELWEWRISIACSKTPTVSYIEELSNFGWWFFSRKFDDVWALEQLKRALKFTGRIEPSHKVIERLAELVTERPIDAVECLRLMVEGDREGLGIYAWREHARGILKAAFNRDKKSQQAARELINRLGARGFLDFRDLLSDKGS